MLLGDSEWEASLLGSANVLDGMRLHVESLFGASKMV